MHTVIKYNMEIMSCIFAVFVAAGIMAWNEASVYRQMTVVFMVLYTFHEWEESRFPGGFYKIFFSKCTIDTTVSEERMHFPVAVYLLIILLTPFVFDEVVAFSLVPLVLALFEGFIHTAGIIIHQLKKPYTPGMITAWIMFGYSIVMIHRLNGQTDIGASDWIVGIMLTIISFFIMETQFVKTAGLTIREFQMSMKNHMMSRIRKQQ